MNLRKTFFILPNLFTLSNVFCGFFALTLCAGDASIDDLYQASLAICFGFLFDLFDGRVARLTKTQSELGLQLDSLADVITFGAAPAMLVYKWGLTKFDIWGVFIAFLFIAGGTLRLARYNVLASRKKEEAITAAVVRQGEPDEPADGNDEAVGKDEPSKKDEGPSRYFVGLPIPAAASVIVALVVVHYRVGGEHVAGQGAIATLVVILAYLMISRVRFRSFKDLRLTKKTLGVIFLLVLACILIVTRFALRASFIFIFLISAYLALGLTEEVFRYAREQRRKRREAKIKRGEPLAAEDQEEIDDEDEVLRELGAD